MQSSDSFAPLLFQGVYSNRLEALVDALAERLSEERSLFSRSLLLFPSKVVHCWLLEELTDRLGVVAGIEFASLEAGLEQLALSLSSEGGHRVLSLRIEKKLALEQLLHSREAFRLPTSLVPTSFASRLASLFERYEEEGDLLWGSWRKRLAEEDFEERDSLRLQAELWEALHRTFDWLDLDTLFRREWLPGATSLLPERLIFFGITHLSPCHYRFLRRIASKIPVYGYLFSPCQLFWGDLLTHRQEIGLMRHLQEKGASSGQQHALEEFLREGHPLLANWGKLGRSTVLAMETIDPHPETHYQLPFCCAAHPAYASLCPEEAGETQESMTLLQAIQADILWLRTPSSPISLQEGDRSLQIHGAHSRWRCVQALHDALCRVIAEEHGRGDAMTYRDVVILCPDLFSYAPYIDATFNVPDSSLRATIVFPPKSRSNGYLNCFFSLLTWVGGRWESSRLFDLLEFSPFRRRGGFQEADLPLLRRWFRQANVRWGADLEHRNRWLLRAHCSREMMDTSGVGSWGHGVGRLLEGVVMDPLGCEASFVAENGGRYSPCVEIEISECELLERWISLLTQMQEQLLPAAESPHDLSTWSSLLGVWAENYLQAEGEEEEAGASLLKEALARLAALDGAVELPLRRVGECLEELCDGLMPSGQIPEGDAILCLPLHGSGVPRRVIALLGLQEGEYPSPFSGDPLDLYRGSDVTPPPTSSDHDRYLFLELLLSARSHFLLFFCGSWEGSSKRETAPSPLLRELVEYIDGAYSLGQDIPSRHCLIEHPFSSYSSQYFEASSSLKSSSLTRFRWASASEANPALNPTLGETVASPSEEGRIASKGSSRFASFFSQRHVTSSPFAPEKVEIFDLSRLSSLAAHPIRDFFRHVLKVSSERIEGGGGQEEETLALGGKESALLRYRSLTTPMAQLIEEASLRGDFPSAPLAKPFSLRLHRQAEEMELALAHYGVSPGGFISLCFTDRCREVRQENEHLWILPPYFLDGEKRCQIVGELSLCTTKGLITYATPQWEECVKSLPAYALFCAALRRHRLPWEPALLPVKNGRKGDGAIQPLFYGDSPFGAGGAEGWLQRFLAYYRESRRSPSPLMPRWLPLLLEGKEKEWKRVLGGREEYLDPHLCWLLRDGVEEELFDRWHVWIDHARRLYGALHGEER